MITNPRIGSEVLIRYNKRRAPHMPLHDWIATVVARSHGPGPRNHLVRVDGVDYVVPCGNLHSLKHHEPKGSQV